MEDCNDAAITYLDVDNDGYGSMTIDACGVTSNDDCDDSNAGVNAAGIEVCGNGIDEDCSGEDEACAILGCTDATACNYNAIATEDDGSCVMPVAEICNGLDDNCDGEVDEFVLNTYFADADGDGFGNMEEVAYACSTPVGYVNNMEDCNDAAITYLDADNDGYGSMTIDACGVEYNDDCDDSNDMVNASGIEVCGNGIDEDCSGSDEVCEIAGCTDMNACNYDANATLEDGTCTYPTESYLNCDGLCLNDGDADGVCDELEVTGCTDATACNYDAMATEDDGSCILPMDEVCNDVDDDCDGEVDEFVTTAYYFDGDADGFGDAQEVVFACSAPAGYVDNADDCDDAIMTFEDLDNDGYGSNNLTACGISNNTDCDDNNASINAGTAEVCNDIDDDCDGSIDNGLTFVGYYADADLDGYGAGNASSFCADPGVGYSTTNDDCDDMNAGINPGATEIEGNDVDENCDGEVLSVSTTSVMTFQLYPNPTRGMLYLEHNANSAVTVTVLDAQGKVVTKESLVQSKWTNDCSNWDAGVYFVRIQGDSFSKKASFIVE